MDNHEVGRVASDRATHEPNPQAVSALPGEYPSRWPWPKGCGPCCRGFDIVSGICSHHYTEQDRIVERVTTAFKRDLHAILRSER